MHKSLDAPPRHSWAMQGRARGPLLLGVTTALILAVIFSACSSTAGSKSSAKATSASTPLATATTLPSAASPSPTSSSAGGGTGGSSPVSVYIGSDDGLLYSINAANGAKNWSIPVGGLAAKPTVANGIIYVATDGGHVAAVGNGSSLWNVTPGGIFEDRPAVDGNQVFVGSDNSSLYALGAGDGSVHWSYATGGAISGTPATANGLVYTGSADGYLYAIHESSGSLAWKTKLKTASEFTSPSLDGNVVYIGDDSGTLTAVNAMSGAVMGSYQVAGGQIGGRPALLQWPRVLRLQQPERFRALGSHRHGSLAPWHFGQRPIDT